MNRIKTIVLTGAAVLMGATGLVALPAASVAALNPAAEITKGTEAAGSTTSQPSLQTRIKEVVNVLLFIIGVVAVIMIILGGIRYVLSNGDSGQISNAKNTILYAVIGLIVAMLAYAIVNFVVVQFS